jgi:hypothetical protein
MRSISNHEIILTIGNDLRRNRFVSSEYLVELVITNYS